MKRLIIAGLIAASAVSAGARPPARQGAAHTFAFGGENFLLDGRPFQIIGCEMHPARIPAEYWAHRIGMAKALGCNTIAAYVFWNYHETTEGTFDFATGNRGIARFISLVQAEGMWVMLRPGPYVYAEWDFGGIPAYLLRIPDIKVRCMNPHYTFLDMTGYRKGVVWVNGHNLGRYWDIGPQKRLFCPAPWLKRGPNEVIVFDLHRTESAPLRGAPTLE